MKKSTFAVMAAALASGLVGFGSMAQAQEQKPQRLEPKTNAVAARPTFDRTDYWAKRLNLTDEQKGKVRPIMEEEAKKYSELRTAKDLTPQERSAKAKGIRENTSAKLKPILTDEQWEKYSKPFQGTGQPIIRTNTTPGTPKPQK